MAERPQDGIRHELHPGMWLAINHAVPLSVNAAGLYGPDKDPGRPVVARIDVGPFGEDGSPAQRFHLLDLFTGAGRPGTLKFPGRTPIGIAKFLLVSDEFGPESTSVGFKGIRGRELVRIGRDEDDASRFLLPEAVGDTALFAVGSLYQHPTEDGRWDGGELLTVMALEPKGSVVIVHTDPNATPLEQ